MQFLFVSGIAGHAVCGAFYWLGVCFLFLRFCPKPAYIYWRMLSRNPDASKKVIFAPKPPINEDADALDYATLDKLIGIHR